MPNEKPDYAAAEREMDEAQPFPSQEQLDKSKEKFARGEGAALDDDDVETEPSERRSRGRGRKLGHYKTRESKANEDASFQPAPNTDEPA